MDLRECAMLATLAAMSEPLFCYCLQIADREFLIQVAHDGIIYWDDYKMRHRLRGTSDQHLEIQVALGDERARERLITEMDEFTIAVPLPREMLLGKGQYYYAGFSLGSGKFEYSLATDPASNGGDYADVKLLSDLPTNGVMETHFSMLRGSPGYYSTGIMTHRQQDVAFEIGAWGASPL